MWRKKGFVVQIRKEERHKLNHVLSHERNIIRNGIRRRRRGRRGRDFGEVLRDEVSESGRTLRERSREGLKSGERAGNGVGLVGEFEFLVLVQENR